MIGKTWREAWEHVIPFLAFPTDVRRVVYTTNTIEALHRQIRKTIKTRGRFPNEEAARKLIYLSIINAPEELEERLQLERSTAFIQNPLRRPTALTHRKSDSLDRGGHQRSGRARARTPRTRPSTRASTARRGRHRTRRRRTADRRLVTPRPPPLRSLLRPPRRRRTRPCLKRPNPTTPTQPRRRQTTQPRPTHHRVAPPAARSRDPRLHRPPHRRRQEQTRRHAATEALPRPPPLPTTRTTRAADDLTSHRSIIS